MLKPMFNHCYTLAAPKWVKDLWRKKFMQITTSKSVVTMRFDGPNAASAEVRATRYGLRVQFARFGWATYVDVDSRTTITPPASSSWALAK